MANIENCTELEVFKDTQKVLRYYFIVQCSFQHAFFSSETQDFLRYSRSNSCYQLSTPVFDSKKKTVFSMNSPGPKLNI